MQDKEQQDKVQESQESQKEQELSQDEVDATEVDVDFEESALKKPTKKFPAWSDFFMALGVFFASVIVGSIVAMVIMAIRGVGTITPDITCIVFIIQFLPIIMFLTFRRRRLGLKINIVKLSFKKINPLLILLGFIMLNIIGIVLEPLLDMFPPENYEQVKAMLGTGVWAVVTMVILAPLLEEILFRGLILGSCKERFGSVWALLISATLFAIAHFSAPIQVIYAFVIGLILGYIYIRTHSLITVMIIHALNNAMAYVMEYYFPKLSDLTTRELIGNDVLYWIIYGACVALFIFTMVKLFITLRNDTELD